MSQRRTQGGLWRLSPPQDQSKLWFPGGFQAPMVAKPPLPLIRKNSVPLPWKMPVYVSVMSPTENLFGRKNIQSVPCNPEKIIIFKLLIFKLTFIQKSLVWIILCTGLPTKDETSETIVRNSFSPFSCIQSFLYRPKLVFLLYFIV